jgi:Ca-activated chloride channel family protein
VLIGLGAVVLGAVSVAFFTTSRTVSSRVEKADETISDALPAASSRPAAAVKAVDGDGHEQEVADAKDDADKQVAIQKRKKAAPGSPLDRPATPQEEGGAARKGGSKCAPGDPLCTNDLEPPPPPLAGATGARLDGEEAIDPNGRFATTYRPGGGHLSAFEAAISQGILTTNDRELVADVGARYVPAVEAPKAKALAFQFDWERAKLQPAGGPVHLRIGLRSSAQAPSARPHLSVHLVLDVSGSMGGKPMDDARKAAQALVDKLAAGDDFSLVTFSNEAKLLIADGPVGSRREQIKKTIAEIKEGGGTNIGDGLRLGYEQAHSKAIPEDAVRVVLLLSDGRANEGITQQGKLAKLALDAFQDGIQTSTFGLGTDYDGPLMSAVAADGAGGYYYLRDSEQIAPALSTELDKRLDPVATAVEIRVRFKPQVELLKVYGSRRLSEEEAQVVRAQEVAADRQAQARDKIKQNRATDQEGGLRFFVPAFARDDSHAVLLKLRLPEGVGSRPVALIEVKYKDRLAKKNAAEEVPLALTYAASDGESGASVNPSVARTVQGFLAGEALAQASALVAQGQRERAGLLLGEREGILREAAASLGEPLFLRDADRLARMLAQLREGSAGKGDPLVLAMLLETAARVHLH